MTARAGAARTGPRTRAGRWLLGVLVAGVHVVLGMAILFAVERRVTREFEAREVIWIQAGSVLPAERAAGEASAAVEPARPAPRQPALPGATLARAKPVAHGARPPVARAARPQDAAGPIQRGPTADPARPWSPASTPTAAVSAVDPSAAASSAAAPVAATPVAPASHGAGAAEPHSPAGATAATALSSGIEYLRAPEPDYPPLARQRGEQGRVIVLAFVDVDGIARRLEVQTSSGSPRLDRAAMQAAADALFKPFVEQGRPVPKWALVKIAFRLDP